MTDLCTPWTLRFERDGTEDFGIICDAEGNDLVASHIPCGHVPPRWKDRGFGDGCFWLPEEGDPVPVLVRQMQVMTAAPMLLTTCKLALAALDGELLPTDPTPDEVRYALRAIIAKAEG